MKYFNTSTFTPYLSKVNTYINFRRNSLGFCPFFLEHIEKSFCSVESIYSTNNKFLFFSENLRFLPIINKISKETHNFSIIGKWPSGVFSNAKVQVASLTFLKNLQLYYLFKKKSVIYKSPSALFFIDNVTNINMLSDIRSKNFLLLGNSANLSNYLSYFFPGTFFFNYYFFFNHLKFLKDNSQLQKFYSKSKIKRRVLHLSFISLWKLIIKKKIHFALCNQFAKYVSYRGMKKYVNYLKIFFFLSKLQTIGLRPEILPTDTIFRSLAFNKKNIIALRYLDFYNLIQKVQSHFFKLKFSFFKKKSFFNFTLFKNNVREKKNQFDTSGSKTKIKFFRKKKNRRRFSF